MYSTRSRFHIFISAYIDENNIKCLTQAYEGSMKKRRHVMSSNIVYSLKRTRTLNT